VHNSGWVQAPGAEILSDPTQYLRLERYVKGVVGAFARDPRILAWDVWNEPDNGNDSSYAQGDPRDKNQIILGLLPEVFAWSRSAHQRPVARRFEFAGRDAAAGAHPDRAVGHPQLPQLRLAGGL
jgi:GH35 family endo-1,4-beta-xylanase